MNNKDGFEFEDNALEREMARPERRRRTHPSQRGLNMLTKDEETSVRQSHGKRIRLRKSKRFDGRALGRTRPRRDAVMKTFYSEVDLPEFKAALAFSGEPKFQMLMAALSAPALHQCSFGELCRRCNLSINDITALWRNHQIHKGMMRMMNHMPQVMEDTAVDAKSRNVPCSNCDGSGKVDKSSGKNTAGMGKQLEGVCPECHGDGKVRIIGDKDSRALAFESAGLRKTAPQQNMQVNIGGQLPSLEQMVADAEAAIEVGATEIVEEPVNGQDSDSGGAGFPGIDPAAAEYPGETGLGAGQTGSVTPVESASSADNGSSSTE